MKCKRMLAFMAVLLFCLAGTATAAVDTESEKDAPVDGAVRLYDPDGTQAATQLASSSELGQYMRIDKPFEAIAVNCPSWADDIGDLTFYLYQWKGSYAGSAKGVALAEQTFVNYTDNAWLIADFDTLPAGEYIWVMRDPVQQVGAWSIKNGKEGVSVIDEKSFYNGAPLDGVYKTAVFYEGTRQKETLAGKESMNAFTAIYPAYASEQKPLLKPSWMKKKNRPTVC